MAAVLRAAAGGPLPGLLETQNIDDRRERAPTGATVVGKTGTLARAAVGEHLEAAARQAGAEVVRHFEKAVMLQVLDQAQRTGRTPQQIALELADRRSLEHHPLWGHRGPAIIRSVLASGWSEQG